MVYGMRHISNNAHATTKKAKAIPPFNLFHDLRKGLLLLLLLLLVLLLLRLLVLFPSFFRVGWSGRELGRIGLVSPVGPVVVGCCFFFGISFFYILFSSVPHTHASQIKKSPLFSSPPQSLSLFPSYLIFKTQEQPRQAWILPRQPCSPHQPPGQQPTPLRACPPWLHPRPRCPRTKSTGSGCHAEAA